MAKYGHGSTIAIDGEVISTLVEFNGFNKSVADIEITTLGDTRKKFMPSKCVDDGELSGTFLDDANAGVVDLLASVGDGLTHVFTITIVATASIVIVNTCV